MSLSLKDINGHIYVYYEEHSGTERISESQGSWELLSSWNNLWKVLQTKGWNKNDLAVYLIDRFVFSEPNNTYLDFYNRLLSNLERNGLNKDQFQAMRKLRDSVRMLIFGSFIYKACTEGKGENDFKFQSEILNRLSTLSNFEPIQIEFQTGGRLLPNNFFSSKFKPLCGHLTSSEPIMLPLRQLIDAWKVGFEIKTITIYHSLYRCPVCQTTTQIELRITIREQVFEFFGISRNSVD